MVCAIHSHHTGWRPQTTPPPLPLSWATARHKCFIPHIANWSCPKKRSDIGRSRRSCKLRTSLPLKCKGAREPCRGYRCFQTTYCLCVFLRFDFCLRLSLLKKIRKRPNENKLSHRWRERALLRGLLLRSCES